MSWKRNSLAPPPLWHMTLDVQPVWDQENMCCCTTAFQGPTFLSGDAWTRQLCWLPLLSFFSGVHTPGSVWVERSDSAESNVLFFQTGVSLFSVSLVWGKTKVSSSEPDRGQNKSVCWVQSHFTGREFQVSLLYIIEEGHTQAVTLDFWLEGRGTWAGPGCVFVFLQTLPAHLISTVSVTVYPTVWQKEKWERWTESELLKDQITQGLWTN